MKLSGANYGMPTTPIDQALAFHAELGLEAIELTVLPGYTTALEAWTHPERARVRALLRQHGLAVSGIADFQSLVGDDPVSVLAHHRGAIDLAAELESGVVPFTSGGGVADWSLVRTRLIDNIGSLASHAERAGVTLALKAHANGAVSRPYQLVDLIEQVASPAFRLCFDMSHYEVQGLSIDQAMRPLLALSVHVEVKASVDRAPRQTYMIPGEPDCQSDFAGQFKLMHALGFDGYVVPEMSVHVYRRPGYDPFAALRLATDTLRPLVN